MQCVKNFVLRRKDLINREVVMPFFQSVESDVFVVLGEHRANFWSFHRLSLLAGGHERLLSIIARVKNRPSWPSPIASDRNGLLAIDRLHRLGHFIYYF
jgi:hypothetical protein